MQITMEAVASLQLAVIAMGGVIESGTKVIGVHKPVVKRRKHKKHNFFKACEVCGNDYKGKLGLSIHQRKAHGIAYTD